jgi:hypothetical protein
MEWNDGSGHYRPPASLRQTAIDAGLPESAWRQSPETLVRPRPVDVNPQLPVVQPFTRSRDGDQAKIPAGPPRFQDLQADLRARRDSPPPTTPPPTTPPTSAPPDTPPTTTPPVAPGIPPQGTRTVRRVTFTYDAESADRVRAVRLRSIDLRDFPPSRPGPVTRFFRGRELAAGLAGMVPSAAASDLSNEALSRVESHFVKAADQAWHDAAQYFRSGPQILADAFLADLAAAAEDVLEGRPSSIAPGRTVADNLTDVITYYDALTDLIDELGRYQDEGRPIVADLDRRAQVLRDVARSAEDAFTWIQTYVPVLFAYYQSFTLWSVRETFTTLAERVGAVERLVDSRMSEYRALQANLTAKREELKGGIVDPRTLAATLLARSRAAQGH